MKKQFWGVVLGLILGAGISGGAASARGGDGGGGVPSPFVEQSNRKVELADGEMYTLFGKVVFDSTQTPYFWIDLDKHPWLANKKRVLNPFYSLQGSPDAWAQYNEKSVQLICIAHVVMSGDDYDIQLSPVWQAGDDAISSGRSRPLTTKF